MQSNKIIYGAKIFRDVIHIYGQKSQIYRDMMDGKKISGLIKESIRKKGPSFRTREKKELFKECKQIEEMIFGNVEGFEI